MAIAALVLGILTFVCLGPIAGILAIVFGFLGMKKANETGTGKGMSIAGIVLGIVGTVLSIILFIVLVVAGDSVRQRAGRRSGRSTPPTTRSRPTRARSTSTAS